MGDHRVEPPKAAGESDEVIEETASLKIADRPAAPSRFFHQPKEFRDLKVREVMGHKAADHEINRRGRRQLENVHSLEVDSICGIGRGLRDANRLGIEVDANQVEVHFLPPRPVPDRAQQIAVPASDVNERQRRTVPGCPDRAAEPPEKWIVTEEDSIEARQVAQDRSRSTGLRSAPSSHSASLLRCLRSREGRIEWSDENQPE
jgi:hypothetical protein